MKTSDLSGSNRETPFNKTKTVSVMDRWLDYLVERKATPVLVWALDTEGDPVSCFEEELLNMPFKKVLELLLGMDMVEDEG